ncbi:restriction endonuclease [Komagataeibacter xylinus]|uniref:restriction endonuclease n=1 Tax=Komagataeibacter xylinus TaxID=28448 RepID=UPI00102F3815|nr:restriction endonuclease [Komagataeibacter xylinus]
MRIWASACLLLWLPASASAAGLFSATHPTLACGDDAALRTLSDATEVARHPPAWRRTLIRQGDCHAVTPDIKWEKIANRNGLPLMRRVPPVPGLAPQYFMTGDITPVGAPAPPPVHVAPPVIVQNRETPLPTDLFFMTRGFQKLGSLILTLMLITGAGWIMMRVLRTVWIMARRRKAINTCLKLAERHRPMLARWYQQADDDNAATLTHSRMPWSTHVERFTRTTLLPALARDGQSALWPAINKTVCAHLTTLAANTARTPSATVLTSGIYHPDMNQAEYAAFCSQWIEKAGWEIRPPVATGLGSVIHCNRNGLKMLVHCWIDRKPVHDDVIWQGIKEKTESRADIGAIVSNAPYTQEALLLGKKHRVFLLHHEDVYKFVSGIEVPDVA